jgi:hypothetical protein
MTMTFTIRVSAGISNIIVNIFPQKTPMISMSNPEIIKENRQDGVQVT